MKRAGACFERVFGARNAPMVLLCEVAGVEKVFAGRAHQCFVGARGRIVFAGLVRFDGAHRTAVVRVGVGYLNVLARQARPHLLCTLGVCVGSCFERVGGAGPALIVPVR